MGSVISSRSTMAAAPAEPNGASIEALFRPSTRLRDSHRDDPLPGGWSEIELLPGLSVENIRATRILWDAFHRLLHGKVVWTSPAVYVCNEHMTDTFDPEVLVLGGTSSLRVHVTQDTAGGAATATCDFVVRLLATCEERDLFIEGSDDEALPLSGAGLSLFFQESRDDLQKVMLGVMALSEDQCLALATMSRLDVVLDISNCSLADDAAGAFVECLQSDGGPVELHYCDIDGQILANALTGDSRVTRLRPYFDETDDALNALFRSLANNRSLLNFDLQHHPISNDSWSVLCESIQAHPTLTCLDLCATRPRRPADDIITLSAEHKAHRTRLLSDMVQCNTQLQTITLSADERDEQIYAEMIQPFLETNQ
jgi:hypothetical protein